MSSSAEDRSDEIIDPRPVSRRLRAFPGGQVRLPRLRRPSNAPAQEPVQDGPIRRNPKERSPSRDRGFEAYYSSESLFDSSAPDPAEAEGPYAVLGLTRAASWEQVSKAHRTLVAQLHPDRYVGEDETVRDAAERRVRDVNEAYATIRRQRAVHRP